MAERTIAACDTLVRKPPLYGVIFGDPPWRFEPYSRCTGMDRAEDNHYATMNQTRTRRYRFRPHRIACCSCVRCGDAAEALDVMAAWGFTCRMHLVWVKDRIGTGLGSLPGELADSGSGRVARDRAPGAGSALLRKRRSGVVRATSA